MYSSMNWIKEQFPATMGVFAPQYQWEIPGSILLYGFQVKCGLCFLMVNLEMDITLFETSSKPKRSWFRAVIMPHSMKMPWTSTFLTWNRPRSSLRPNTLELLTKVRVSMISRGLAFPSRWYGGFRWIMYLYWITGTATKITSIPIITPLHMNSASKMWRLSRGRHHVLWLDAIGGCW